MDTIMMTTLILSAAIILGFVYVAFKMYEKSKPSVESIVLIAILVAIATIGRLAFIAVPGVQACSFIVIMVGIVYGRNEGFLVGALAALVSDLFTGLGYWSLFQMIGWGLMGYTAGLITTKLDNTIARAAFGFAWGFLYGWITDISGIFYIVPTATSVIALFAASAFFDLLHAIANAVLLVIFYKWFKKIFLRAKTKFLQTN
ncbi:MAG: ECF transporter S component [Methanobrevibacter sp.]|uniref:ECF transporter S component n=1 Tax=Methanobrevibacter sp. TaxID=66852 RepID=UPI0026E08DCF|nr:ECF transporter S component [Methanobrevibacter sp.]MDO5848189.1 ECF transporter S component [Methanobrevibacter sp.]